MVKIILAQDCCLYLPLTFCISVFLQHIPLHRKATVLIVSTKAVYFCPSQETKSIMEEAQEGRGSLTYLLALVFFCSEKM